MRCHGGSRCDAARFNASKGHWQKPKEGTPCERGFTIPAHATAQSGGPSAAMASSTAARQLPSNRTSQGIASTCAPSAASARISFRELSLGSGRNLSNIRDYWKPIPEGKTNASTDMKTSVIVWDIKTVPDLAKFAAANDLVGKRDADIREVLGNKFPKHVYHTIVCIGALVAHRESDHWAVDAMGAPHVGERSEKQLVAAFCD